MFGLQPAANQEEHGDDSKQVGARKASQKAEEQQSADASGCRTAENDPAAAPHPRSEERDYRQGHEVYGQDPPGDLENSGQRKLNPGRLDPVNQPNVSAGMKDRRAQQHDAPEWSQPAHGFHGYVPHRPGRCRRSSLILSGSLFEQASRAAL